MLYMVTGINRCLLSEEKDVLHLKTEGINIMVWALVTLWSIYFQFLWCQPSKAPHRDHYVRPSVCPSVTLCFLVHLSRRLKCTIVITRCLSSVIRPSSVRPSLTFHIFNFSSETTERNSTKLDRKQDLNVLYQVCVFWVGRKTRWPPWPLIG